MKLIKRLFNKQYEETERSKIELEKHKVNLDKTINLMKRHKEILSNHKARVLVVMDYSVSMTYKYSEIKYGTHDSEMQKVLVKLFPIALKFDDNRELEVYLFQNDFKKMESMTQNNFATYVNSVIKESVYSMGGTEYSPVLESIVNEHLAAKNLETEENKYPVFVLFLTDGDNSNNDKPKTTKLIREIANQNIFIQFIGIGNDRFDYLEKLDTLEDRVCDNVGFEKFSSLARADDAEVYNRLLKQYAEWLTTKPE